MTVSRLAFSALLLSLLLPAQTGARGTGLVFVSNERTNNIAVIDPGQDYRVIKWIETSPGPREMKFRDGKRQLLVACGGGGAIDAIDVATLAVTDHISTGGNPEMFELSRDEQTLYVPDVAGAAVLAAGFADKIIGGEIRTGARPGGIAASGDGKTLYVTSGISDWVHVVDLEAGAVTDNIVAGTGPKQLFQVPGGKYLWVSNEVSGQVSIIDRATNRVSGTLEFRPPGSGQMDVTPGGLTATRDGKTAFVPLGRAGYVAIADTVTRTVLDYVPAGRGARAVALGAGEKTLFVVNGLSDDVSIVDVARRKVVGAVAVGRGPHSVLVDD